MRRSAPVSNRAALLPLVMSLITLGCGDEGKVEPESGFALALAPESGDGQHGPTGRELTEPLQVVVTRDGSPVQGVAVAWTAEDGAIDSHGLTDARGIATASWTLPRVASSELKARAALQDRAVPGVAFHATATFPSLEIVEGDDQQGVAGTELPELLRVRVTWQGAPFEGEPVHWSSNVEPAVDRTDADGIATAAWRLRAYAGAVSATARLEGSGPPGVTFHATAMCPASQPCVRFPRLAYVSHGAVLGSDLEGAMPLVLADEATRPAWSHDGLRIAFTRPTNDNLDLWQLCVAEADGSDARCAVGDRAASIVGRPSWSPDGEKVAFSMWVHDCPGGQCGQFGGFYTGLRILHTATMLVDSVETPPLTSVSWSPDGRTIAFTAFNSKRPGLMRPDGSDLHYLPPIGSYSASEVAWSPDGRRLALTLTDESVCPWYCDTAIGVVEADGTQLRVLATARTSEFRYVSWPAWTPDGALIAYTLSEGDAAGYDAVGAGADILVAGAEGETGDVLVAGGGLPAWRP